MKPHAIFVNTARSALVAKFENQLTLHWMFMTASQYMSYVTGESFEDYI
ncbi:hypothetical protein [Bartonella florencae]|nr:hypothetical protein [Bartonella florencae]